jgi:hypothetical protein
MKLEVIKKEFRRRAIIFLPAILASIAVFGGAYSYSSSNETRLEDAQNTAKALEQDIHTKKTQYIDQLKNFNIYKSLPKNKLPTKDGLAIVRERYQVILPLIQDFKQKYFFSKMKVDLSEIKKSKPEGMLTHDMVSNGISMDISAPTDELIYSFINDLKTMLPGYVVIDSFRIVRAKDINNDSINTYIKSGAPVVTATIVLNWNILAEPSNDPAGQGGAPTPQ